MHQDNPLFRNGRHFEYTGNCYIPCWVVIETELVQNFTDTVESEISIDKFLFKKLFGGRHFVYTAIFTGPHRVVTITKCVRGRKAT